MAGDRNWADRISAYRRRFCLSQEVLGEKLGVTAATVSRWETGRQSPDILHHGQLKSMLGLAGFNDASEWIIRVNNSTGFELLLDSKEVIVEASDAFFAFHGAERANVIGSSLAEFWLRYIGAAIDEGPRSNRAPLSQRFLFDGVRLIQQTFDLKIDGVCMRLVTELWPILTAEEALLYHLRATRYEPSPEPELCNPYRLVRSHVIT